MSNKNVVDLGLLEISLLEKVAALALRHANSRFPGSQDAFKMRFEAGQRIGAWAQAIEDYLDARPRISETRGDKYRRDNKKGDRVS